MGMIQLTQVFNMLTECATGHSVLEKTHHFWIRYGSLVFIGLPKGGHGKLGNHAIEAGHVRRMSRILQIEDCAFGFLGSRIQR